MSALARASVWPSLVGRVAKALGPGFITADDYDPSGIATYSVAGARLGTHPLWAAPLLWPLMAAVQMMSARIGLVTGEVLAGALRRKYPRWLALILVVYVIVAFDVRPAWGAVLRDSFLPQLPRGREAWATLVAILGTTLCP